MDSLQIKNALISVFYKDGLEVLLNALKTQNIGIYSTGGTAKFIEERGGKVNHVEDLTGYPSIFGGRVKTLHPAVFGGILFRRDHEGDIAQAKEFNIPNIDLIVVDLYPFEETLQAGGTAQEIIEKIDIGGVSLIRAAAKNFNSTCVICDKADYSKAAELIMQNKLDLAARKSFAAKAFKVTQAYDELIGSYLAGEQEYALRYGENPHQKASFRGNMEDNFERIQGKEISYNNLLDIEAAMALLGDFDSQAGATFAIIKHNNACGIATRATVADSYDAALAADPVSAFGGIMICNKPIDMATAQKINSIFFEILLAPGYEEGVEELFTKKAQRTLLKITSFKMSKNQKRTILNGTLIQDRDGLVENRDVFKTVTHIAPTPTQLSDLEFALRVVKHTKSNAIVLVKNGQLLASGTGQTSRVDALNQAVEKAKRFGFDLQGCVMASDAFFPFPDCVEIGATAGVKAIVQPGGSVKDQMSIDEADKLKIAMVFAGNRHFKH
ncbi:MAG: bifunctional phosphoribosylaminoimidazolecarboxamide formyltransferase/IMP cyclohydrolase [Bacteroidia bacterium]|nr:bifunctional phosphoribosylaminoimidazolecarboxamide formyltransferase/IMP cyclohydrolase [Bacteroidia bacterium]MCO5253798.1 bifunctional phosphoribosylaminoimidazolecarboxamide formyltransferase/IMP cyclohydrolase [Bacteroidota bacterium]MCZ2131080.1 bifunctional phosphoribosylaminoimidazolecarboxamide formyltransferase/IMP cyclohydrolase [Bacteroidia bacterium]